MNPRKTGFSLIFLISLFFLLSPSCVEVKWNAANRRLEPDLTIRSATFRIISHSPPKGLFGRVILPIMIEREFVLTIENIGSGDWIGDLLIGYSRSEAEFRNGEISGYQEVAFENNRLPYASRRQVVFSLKLTRDVKHIRFTVNPPVPDFLQEEWKRVPEIFYRNNTIELKL